MATAGEKYEFWAFKSIPNVLKSEKIIFTFDGRPVAEAICHHIEKPGVSKCSLTNKYEDYWKAFWEPSTFKRYAQPKKASGRIGPLYHGTRAEFSSFETQPRVKSRHYLDFGFHFTADTDLANTYADLSQGEDKDRYNYSSGQVSGNPVVYPVFLKIENLLDLDIPLPGVLKEALEKNIKVSKYLSHYKININDGLDSLTIATRVLGREGITTVIKGCGYNGVHYTWEGHSCYITFASNQVKSAIGNNGEFNKDQSSIIASETKMDYPDWKGKVGSLPLNRFYYHATSAGNLNSIAQSGLTPSSDKQNFGGEFGINSVGKVFFCDNPDEAMYYAKLTFKATLRDDQVAHIPLCLRFKSPKNIDHSQQQYGGHIEEYWTDQTIPAKGIQVFWGGRWSKLISGEWDEFTYDYRINDEEYGFYDWEGALVSEDLIGAVNSLDGFAVPKIASTPVSQIKQWAYPYADQFCPGEPGRVPIESLDWKEDRAFDLHQIDGWDASEFDWLNEEEKERDDPDFFNEMCEAIKNHTIEEIFVVQGTDGKFYVWEGNHRVGMARMLGVDTMPAFVGYQKSKKTAASDEVESAEALKYPNEHAYLKHHYTGPVPSSAYSGENMFSWQKPEKYPKLLKTVTLKDGQQVELRQEESKNSYSKTKEVMVKNTAGNEVPYFEHVRDEKGALVDLTDEEVKAKGLPIYDTSIMAFNKEGQCVAQASDEWGADLVAVREDYQKKGLGTILLTEFRRQFSKVRQMGQMTPAGTNLTKSYYRSLTGKPPEPVEGPEQNPEYIARRTIWRFFGNLVWADYEKFTPEQAAKLKEFEKKFEERTSDVHEVLNEIQAWVKTQPVGTFSQHAENALAGKTASMVVLKNALLKKKPSQFRRVPHPAYGEQPDAPKTWMYPVNFGAFTHEYDVDAPNPTRTDITNVIKELRERYKKEEGGYDGMCNEFAQDLIESVKGAELFEIGFGVWEDAPEDQHAFVLFKGKFYDAYTPLGVADWRDLPFLHNEEQSKTAAPRSVWYHGTKFTNLRSILAQGLIPDVKNREWADDPSANGYRPSRESYGGIYCTTNISTAIGAPRDTGYYGPGRMVLVAMELQPNTMYLDEDDINFTNLSNACPHLSDPSYHAPMYYIALTQPNVPENWKEGLEEIKQRYIDEGMKYWTYKFNEIDNDPMHPELEKRFKELLPSTWEAALTRQTAHAVAKMKDYDLKNSYREVFYDVDWDAVPPKERLFPTVAQGEAAWRKASEQLTRTLKSKAHGKRSRSTARIEAPVGFHGSNHIIAVAEIREGHQWRGDSGKDPVTIVTHFGKLPDDFFRQWKKLNGSEINLVQAGQDKTSSLMEPIPSVVYHGTENEFEEFQPGHSNGWSVSRKGYYFTDDLESAKEFGSKIIEAKIAMNHPLDLRNPYAKGTQAEFEQVYALLPQYDKEQIDKGQYSNRVLNTVNGGYAQTDDFISAAEKVGYDGLIMKDSLGGASSGSFWSFIVFKPSQIKVSK